MSNYHKTFYLGGGMTNLPPDERNGWRVEMEELFSEYYHVNVFNPCNHWDVDGFIANDREVMNYDLRKLKNSDVLVVNFNDPASLGTMAEIATAYEVRIPIIGICPAENWGDVHPWAKLMCDRVFETIEDAYEYLSAHYCFND